MIIRILLVLGFLVLGLFPVESLSSPRFNIDMLKFNGLSSSWEDYINRGVGDIEQKVNNDIKDFTVEGILHGVSNSMLIASSANSSYAPSVAPVNMGVNISLATDKSDSDLPFEMEDITGVAAQASFIMSFSPSSLNLLGPQWNRLRVFTHAMSLQKEIDPVDLSVQSFGAGASYRLFDPKSVYHTTWQGVFISGGIKYSEMDISMRQGLKSRLKYNGSPPYDMNHDDLPHLNFSGRGDLRVHSSVTSVPLEVSSAIKLFKFIGLYGGYGLDLNHGTTSSSIEASGPVTIKSNNSDPFLNQVIANVKANANESVSVESFSSRRYLGLSLNFVLANLYLQYSESLSSKTEGFTLGMEF